MLRKLCGAAAGCEWHQTMHATERVVEFVCCTLRFITRQRHVQLNTQQCPVRSLIGNGLEDLGVTSVYAAWTAIASAMHMLSKTAMHAT